MGGVTAAAALVDEVEDAGVDAFVARAEVVGCEDGQSVVLAAEVELLFDPVAVWHECIRDILLEFVVAC